MRRALLATVAGLALMSAEPAHAQLGHISRGVDDLVELLTGIFDSVTKGLEESPVPDPGSYITRLAAELELAPWYTQAGWEGFVTETYPTQYLSLIHI